MENNAWDEKEQRQFAQEDGEMTRYQQYRNARIKNLGLSADATDDQINREMAFEHLRGREKRIIGQDIAYIRKELEIPDHISDEKIIFVIKSPLMGDIKSFEEERKTSRNI